MYSVSTRCVKSSCSLLDQSNGHWPVQETVTGMAQTLASYHTAAPKISLCSTPSCHSCVEHLFTSWITYSGCASVSPVKPKISPGILPCDPRGEADRVALTRLDSARPPPNYYQRISASLQNVPHMSCPVSGHASQTRFTATV